MEFLHLTYEKRAPLAWITINRPKVLNALNAATLEELSQAVEMAAADDEVRVVILTGTGGKAFIAGADIGELAVLDETSGRTFAQRGQGIFRRIETLGKPVIACIQGYALGGGCELAMACTLRIASEDSRLGQPEVKLGILAGFGGTQRLPRLVGRGAAMKMLLTGAMVSANEALRIGLVDEVAASDKLMARAEELALEIAKNAPIAVERTMRAIDYGLDHTLEDGLLEEARHFGHCCTTQDKVEGTNAFLEKRAAVWSGK
ncbi:enoyl-CoA hydratase-related protein [Acidicapsa dinghuensis]|uniref:Enoyl-CoA hydratase-related protein n=1 Tax=Acidicapsa dinghuensis TaxID=2218256 RepID=A0ABW1EKQ8_9BACT|nr:enoyl-CoA hydratase-related protein [Acidicapsa dinghuensis]